MNPNAINKILVRAPNWVGDAVLSIAALRELRHLLPDAQLTIVSRPGTADIFMEADFVDEVLNYDRHGLASGWKQARAWRQKQFDLALLLQNAFDAAAIAFLAGVPIRVGYDTQRRGFLLTHSIPVPAWKDERHEIFYYLHIVNELERKLLGKEPVGTAEPRFGLDISEKRKQPARTFLLEHGVNLSKPLVLLCPGSVNSRAKRWPAERYAELSDKLAASGATSALIGSTGEIDVSRDVADLARQRPIVLTGQTSVAEVAALISIADVLITNDTGPAHIGTAVGTPTLVIFGPTNPLTTRPFSATGEIIRHPPDCAPCMLRDCPIDHRCMSAITVDEVFARARQLIGHRLEVAV